MPLLKGNPKDFGLKPAGQDLVDWILGKKFLLNGGEEMVRRIKEADGLMPPDVEDSLLEQLGLPNDSAVVLKDLGEKGLVCTLNKGLPCDVTCGVYIRFCRLDMIDFSTGMVKPNWDHPLVKYLLS